MTGDNKETQGMKLPQSDLLSYNVALTVILEKSPPIDPKDKKTWDAIPERAREFQKAVNEQLIQPPLNR